MSKIKILCVSDIHNSNQFLRSLNEHLTKNKYNLILCAGDVVSLSNKKGMEFLKKFTDLITRLHQTKLFMIQGNCESEKMINLMRKKNVLLHLKLKKFRGHGFYGIGGWMEDVGEISNLSRAKPRDLKSKISNTILLTHLPPKRQVIKTLKHKSIKTKISDGPAVHLCGHLHAPGMIWKIGDTLVVKIPTAMYGGAAVLKMPSKKVRFIKI